MTTIKIEKKKPGVLFLLLIVGLIGFALLSVAWARTNDQYQADSLKQDAPIMLQVPPVAQSQTTSCGEAVIVMAYNFAHPQSPLIEGDVIFYATAKGYFTEASEPFTSPVNMAKITQHYTTDYSSGAVFNDQQGLSLLIRKLQNGEPVIIDILTRLDDPASGAHFVLVTGLAKELDTAITVYYNDPQTGTNESAVWGGETGIWHAWKNNPDPGGHGWWLVLSPE